MIEVYSEAGDHLGTVTRTVGDHPYLAFGYDNAYDSHCIGEFNTDAEATEAVRQWHEE